MCENDGSVVLLTWVKEGKHGPSWQCVRAENYEAGIYCTYNGCQIEPPYNPPW